MYLYAVDPNLNVMIDTEALQRVFNSKKSEIMKELEKYRIIDIGRAKQQRKPHPLYVLSSLELTIVTLGVVVFVGALISALCIICVRRNKR